MNKILQGDSLEILKTIETESIDCVITSPPYWALRDYGNSGQIGQEDTFDEYIRKLCNIFDQVKRVLKKEGTCWVNIGDTYGGSGNKGNLQDPMYGKGRNGQNKAKNKNAAKKCMLQIPSRFAIEMCNRGWILRNEIIWHKPNAMPSSVKDRFTMDYEKVFLFVKKRRYYFETQYEPYSPNTDIWYRKELREGKTYDVKKPYKGNTPYLKSKAQNPSDSKRRILESMKNSEGRNKRCVWSINTKPFNGAHFAVFPETLIEPMIRAGCKKGGIILDPFFGSGTTGKVALKLQRKYLGIELNEEYIEIAKKRLENIQSSLL